MVWLGCAMAVWAAAGGEATGAPGAKAAPPLPAVATSTSRLFGMLLLGPEAADSATEQRYEEAPIREETPTVQLGGALRFNFSFNTYGGPSQFPSASSFDVFRLDVGARYADLVFSAQYRFYAGYNMLQHGYIGTELEREGLSFRLGVTQVPFGVLPYASHNFFFSLPYYVGLEDDYDLGIKTIVELGDLEIQLAFFKNDEGGYSGSSLDSARYSYDLVRTRPGVLSAAGISEARSLEETNQANLRIAWTLRHGEHLSAELGFSGQIGQTFERSTNRRGVQWAMAGHLDADLGPVNVVAEGGRYEIGMDESAVADSRLVAMGAYDAPYTVAARAEFLTTGIAWEIPLSYWLFESITFYDDFSALYKDPEEFEDSFQNTAGFLLAVGPVYTYLDFAAGRNHPFLGLQYVRALGPGDPTQSWELRFNINVGWYF